MSEGENKKQWGGKRNPPGGRPRGSRNVLPLGAIRALTAGKCASARLDKNEDPEARTVVEHAFGRVADVLNGRVHPQVAGSVLKAAGMVTDAIAGKQSEKVEHSGDLSITVVDPYAAPPAPAPAAPVAPIIRRAAQPEPGKGGGDV